MPTVFTADDCPLAISVLGTRIVKLVDPASIVLRIVTLTTNLLYINQDAAGLVKIFIKDGEPKERFSATFSATVVTGFLESGRVVFKPAPAGDFIRNNPFKKRTWRKANKTETKDK